MKEAIQFKISERTLVVSCTECALATLRLPSVATYLPVPCQVVQTEEQFPLFLAAIQKHQPERIVIVGHDNCNVILKTLFGNNSIIANNELYHYLESILHRLACQSHIKPRELLREVAKESVLNQVSYVRELLAKDVQLNALAIEVMGAWSDPEGELVFINR